MKTIISILTKISQDVARIADALQSRSSSYSSYTYPSNKTSNPTNSTITKFSTFTSSRTPQDEAVDRLFKIVTEEHLDTYQNQKALHDLKVKWPSLHAAITALVIAKLDAQKNLNLNKKKWNIDNG